MHAAGGIDPQRGGAPRATWRPASRRGSVDDDDPEPAAAQRRAGAARERPARRVGIVRHEHDRRIGMAVAEVVDDVQSGDLGARRRGRRARSRPRCAPSNRDTRRREPPRRRCPSETLLRKRRPHTSPTSIRPSMPSLRASRAAIGSAGSSPRSRAKWLRVPAGTQTNGRSCASAAAATVASDPSPPATASASAPSARASSIAVARFRPGPNSTTLIPRSLACAAIRGPAPRPDLGLTNRTGRRGGSTAFQPIRRGDINPNPSARVRGSPSAGHGSPAGAAPRRRRRRRPGLS